MKKIKQTKTINLISNLITVLVLLYLIFAQEWVYFFVLSMFIVVLLLMEITRSAQEAKPSITLNVNQTLLKETDASELAKQILKELEDLEKKGE